MASLRHPVIRLHPDDGVLIARSSLPQGMVVADIGHYESEQFTIDLLAAVLREKFPTFATLKTGVNTNPVHYF